MSNQNRTLLCVDTMHKHYDTIQHWITEVRFNMDFENDKAKYHMHKQVQEAVSLANVPHMYYMCDTHVIIHL